MGRPPLEIDSKQVFTLASINCTMEEIGLVVGCSVDTLERRFADVIKEGRAHGRSSLRRHMWEAVQKGNITMMIFLSKNLLGYADRTIQQTSDENEQSKLIINFGGKVGSSNPNKVDSGESLPPLNQEPPQGFGDLAQSLPVQAVVPVSSGGTQPIDSGAGPGIPGEKG